MHIIASPTNRITNMRQFPIESNCYSIYEIFMFSVSSCLIHGQTKMMFHSSFCCCWLSSFSLLIVNILRLSFHMWSNIETGFHDDDKFTAHCVAWISLWARIVDRSSATSISRFIKSAKLSIPIVFVVKHSRMSNWKLNLRRGWTQPQSRLVTANMQIDLVSQSHF